MTTFQKLIGNQFGEQMGKSFSQAKRNAILKAASLVFANSGYQRADVQEIADIAGVSNGTVYRYFYTKEYLFWAVSIWSGESLYKQLMQVVESDLDNIMKLKRLGDTWKSFFFEHTEIIELFAWQRVLNQGVIPREVKSFLIRQLFGPFYRVVEAGVEKDEFIIKDVQLFTLTLVTALSGAMIFHCYGKHFISLSDHIDSIYGPIIKVLEDSKPQ
ncbi:MAG: TetR/AcrR family transcriptional regulator [Thermoguttaceae bacterium]